MLNNKFPLACKAATATRIFPVAVIQKVSSLPLGNANARLRVYLWHHLLMVAASLECILTVMELQKTDLMDLSPVWNVCHQAKLSGLSVVDASVVLEAYRMALNHARSKNPILTSSASAAALDISRNSFSLAVTLNRLPGINIHRRVRFESLLQALKVEDDCNA